MLTFYSVLYVIILIRIKKVCYFLFSTLIIFNCGTAQIYGIEDIALSNNDWLDIKSLAVSDNPNKFVNSVNMSFVYIKPGTFIMGSPLTEPGRKPDETEHKVTISKGFYMQTTQVTQKQWRDLMGDAHVPCFNECGENCPVDRISWEDSMVFIEKLNKKEGTDRYRLPTEAEWEYACRAGTDTAFSTGNHLETECEFDPVADKAAWYCANSKGSIQPVAQKESNAWGLYDMHGNLYDWCLDWYDDYPERHVTDPFGPETGETKVLRGGAWLYLIWHARSAHRRRHVPAFRNYYTGFRVVYSNDLSQKQ